MSGGDGVPGVGGVPDPRFSMSLVCGLAILASFGRDRLALRVSEIAEIVGLSRSTAHRYASTLVALGYLEQDDKRRYLLSRRAGGPGSAVLGALALRAGAREVLGWLREQTGYTVSLGVLDGTRATYVLRLRGHRAGQYEADLGLGMGVHVPVYCTAIGKALLAGLPEGERREILAGVGFAPGGSRAVSRRSLAVELARVRVNGLAVCGERCTAGVRSVAVVIDVPSGCPAMAISVTIPPHVYALQPLTAVFGSRLKTAAERIATNLRDRSDG
jgi:IclR family transcriptional regulator, pca regulon regulatory protein